MEKGNETIDAASGSLGFASATFAITVNLLVALQKSGVLSNDDAQYILLRSKRLVEGIKLAEQVFHANAAPLVAQGAH